MAQRDETINQAPRARRRRSARGAIAACLAGPALLAPGCAEGDSAAEAPPAEADLAIKEGEAAPDETEVVQLERGTGGVVSNCSGVIVGANLVLTARHCVEAWVGDDDACGGGSFDKGGGGDVTIKVWFGRGNSVDVVAGRDDVRVARESDATICGSDLALIVAPALAAYRNEPWFRAASPRLDRPAEPGESYAAVGFGNQDQSSEAGAGVRRRRSGLAVACSGDACGGANVVGDEWRGEAGVCDGDSGGPALDERGRVVGIASRSNTDDCGDPVYSSVYAWREWLRDEALAAARDGAFRAPPWTQRVAEADASGGDDDDGGGGGGGSDGCAVTPGRAAHGAGPVAAFGAAAFAWLRARRRRRG